MLRWNFWGECNCWLNMKVCFFSSLILLTRRGFTDQMPGDIEGKMRQPGQLITKVLRRSVEDLEVVDPFLSGVGLAGGHVR